MQNSEPTGHTQPMPTEEKHTKHCHAMLGDLLWWLCAVLSMAAVFALAILKDPFLGNKSHAALWGQV